MKAKQCDRCGSFYQADDEKVTFKGVFERKKTCLGYMDFSMDLCDSCYDSLEKWIEDVSENKVYHSDDDAIHIVFGRWKISRIDKNK